MSPGFRRIEPLKMHIRLFLYYQIYHTIIYYQIYHVQRLTFENIFQHELGFGRVDGPLKMNTRLFVRMLTEFMLLVPEAISREVYIFFFCLYVCMCISINAFMCNGVWRSLVECVLLVLTAILREVCTSLYVYTDVGVCVHVRH